MQIRVVTVASFAAALLLIGHAVSPVAEASELREPAAQKTAITHGSIVRNVQIAAGKDQPKPIKRRFDAVILENRYLKVTVSPELGERIPSIIDKTTGRELFYQGTIRYSGQSLGGSGMSTGGIHVNHPHYHCGSAHVNPLPYVTRTLDDGSAVVILCFTSYPHLQRTVMTISLAPDEAVLRINYRFENLAAYPMGFNPWVNAACKAREDVQFILPTDWVAEHWFGYNENESYRLQPWPINEEGTDRSYLKENKGKGLSVFSYGVTDGYMGIYYHDDNAGFARIFDPTEMVAAKAYGPKNLDKPDAWCEVWGAISHNMEDPLWIGPHEVREVSDLWYPISGTGGMTWADENGAVNLKKKEGQLEVGVCVPRDYGLCAIRVIVDGDTVVQASRQLDPTKPFYQVVEVPDEADDVRLTVADRSGRLVLQHHKFFAPRPRKKFTLPEKPWHRRSMVRAARWQEAFTPMMSWGPWYYPPKTYADAIKTEPDNHEALLGRARSLIKDASPNLFRSPRKVPDADKIKEAKSILEKLAAAQKPDSRAVYLLGMIQMQQGERDAAAETFGRLVNAGGETAMAHYNLGLLAAAAGNWKQAAKHARTAVALAPESTLTRQLLAITLLERNQPHEVEELLAPLYEANPTDVATIELLRRAAVALGNHDRANRLVAELARLKGVAARQYKAGMAQVTSLEAGRDLDVNEINTMKGPDMLGRKP